MTPDNEDNDLPEADLITSQPLTTIPGQSVLYDLATIPDHPFQPDMNFNENFSQVLLICRRRCCKVFKAHMNNEFNTVIIKMIDNDRMLIINELEILSKLQHTNIIQLIGTGDKPRRFIVLPYLSGGTLQAKLKENRKPYAFISRYSYYTPTFTYLRVLQLAKIIAQALHYMHVQAHPGACFIHRGR